MRFGIIADDLTGACDTAGRLTLLGYRPVVALGPEARRSKFPAQRGNEVVVLSARSRDFPLREALARVRAAAGWLERNSCPVSYLKIDSTLRGPWVEMLVAVARVTRPDLVVVCPAFPARGRFVRKGELVFGKDLRGKLESASIFHLLRKRGRVPVHAVGLRAVRRGPRGIRKALGDGELSRCIVFDAERESDLRAIAAAFQNQVHHTLWVGSAGLVRHVLPKLRERSADSAGPAFERRPWLFVQGSCQEISREQFRRLEARPDLRVIHFSMRRIRRAIRAEVESAVEAVAGGKHLALVTPDEWDARVPAAFRRFLDRVLEALSRRAKPGGILVTGGSTAEAVCDSLRVRTLRVIQEIRPGIPLSLTLDGAWPGVPIITKAGGFGSPDEVRKIFARHLSAQ